MIFVVQNLNHEHDFLNGYMSFVHDSFPFKTNFFIIEAIVMDAMELAPNQMDPKFLCRRKRLKLLIRNIFVHI